jgi:ABC-type glycerol-3-phosphate transport system substrate-binding protein
MKRSLNLAAAALATALLLAACGGGGSDSSDLVFEDEDPEQSEQSGSVTLAGSTAARNGVYSSTATFLNQVEKRNPIGGDPELCRYRFARLDQAADGLTMSGDIRYQPGTNTVRVMFITIQKTNDDSRKVEYSLPESVLNAVDRTNDEIDFAGAELRSSSGERITLTGSIPMRDERPEGC